MLKTLCVIVICGTAMMASSQSVPPNGTRSSISATNVRQQQRPTKSTAIIGLDGVREKTQGTLNIEDERLCFVHSGSTSQIPAAAMEDVITGEDSQRVIRGTLGTLSMFAPYESGRALSMLRSKLDSLTIQYHCRSAQGKDRSRSKMGLCVAATFDAPTNSASLSTSKCMARRSLTSSRPTTSPLRPSSQSSG